MTSAVPHKRHMCPQAKSFLISWVEDLCEESQEESVPSGAMFVVTQQHIELLGPFLQYY